MRAASFVVAGLAGLALSVGLGGAAPGPKDTPEPPLFFPVTVGAKWTYRYGANEAVEEVTKVERRDRDTLVTVKRGTDLETFSVSAAGVEYHGGRTSRLDPPVWKLRQPARPGDSWEVRTPLVRGLWAPTGRMTIKDPAPVVTPAGRFKAVVVEFEVVAVNGAELRPPQTHTFWWVEGVGLVQARTPTGWVELLAFDPGHAPASKR